MRKLSLGLSLLAIGVMAVSCAIFKNPQKEFCQNSDWGAVGRNDGLMGINRLAALQTSCGQYDVTVDAHSYNYQNELGLKTFCSFDNGKKLGLEGEEESRLPEACNSFTNKFKEGYTSGIKEYCTYEHGRTLGRNLEEPSAVCTAKNLDKEFLRGHQAGLKEGCSYQRGKQNGAEGKKPHQLCEKFADYGDGFFAGQKKYCSYERGVEDGEKDTFDDGMEVYCPKKFFKKYKAGFADGFCNYDMGRNYGYEGRPFPPVCEGRSYFRFERGYADGERDRRHEQRERERAAIAQEMQKEQDRRNAQEKWELDQQRKAQEQKERELDRRERRVKTLERWHQDRPAPQAPAKPAPRRFDHNRDARHI